MLYRVQDNTFLTPKTTERFIDDVLTHRTVESHLKKIDTWSFAGMPSVTPTRFIPCTIFDANPSISFPSGNTAEEDALEAPHAYATLHTICDLHNHSSYGGVDEYVFRGQLLTVLSLMCASAYYRAELKRNTNENSLEHFEAAHDYYMEMMKDKMDMIGDIWKCVTESTTAALEYVGSQGAIGSPVQSARRKLGICGLCTMIVLTKNTPFERFDSVAPVGTTNERWQNTHSAFLAVSRFCRDNREDAIEMMILVMTMGVGCIQAFMNLNSATRDADFCGKCHASIDLKTTLTAGACSRCKRFLCMDCEPCDCTPSMCCHTIMQSNIRLWISIKRSNERNKELMRESEDVSAQIKYLHTCSEKYCKQIKLLEETASSLRKDMKQSKVDHKRDKQQAVQLVMNEERTRRECISKELASANEQLLDLTATSRSYEVQIKDLINDNKRDKKQAIEIVMNAEHTRREGISKELAYANEQMLDLTATVRSYKDQVNDLMKDKLDTDKLDKERVERLDERCVVLKNRLAESSRNDARHVMESRILVEELNASDLKLEMPQTRSIATWTCIVDEPKVLKHKDTQEIAEELSASVRQSGPQTRSIGTWTCASGTSEASTHTDDIKTVHSNDDTGLRLAHVETQLAMLMNHTFHPPAQLYSPMQYHWGHMC